ncbi:2Fe-2S iron-sulfur cluster-binding protein [Caulobacter sp. Root343]|uniref:2Fe-2S iron-sulfur cluster-binding protein n=1 Tax=Caulobacter sp. Root343 TaxID=1736520 RepID=UPI0006F735CA|nr:2Fe-2S iron-sulfur cluster-binding protein [Caulobacter sp. Root343]KQV64118.1 2Fe-2S ferredoxin [Caulobacter sp. Root343]
MLKITFVQLDGARRDVEASAGISVMQAATRNGVAGIDAECGGACACATCHVYVDEAWRERVGPPQGGEADMLEFALEVDPDRSRLSCQITISEALDGLVVHLPAAQQ